MQPPNLLLNIWPVLTSCVVCFVFGGLWYGPLFGKRWGTIMGFDMSKKPPPGTMKRAFTLQIVGLVMTTVCMAHFVAIAKPSTWGVSPDTPSMILGFYSAIFAWLGFQVPLQFGKVSWEGRPFELFYINAGHDFFTLQIMAQIIAHWR